MTATATIGKIVQIIGPVLDVEFEAGHLPELYNALEITGTSDTGDPIRVVAEVQQHIGRNQVRAVAMSTTDGVVRGMDVVDTGQAIAVPVGEAALGRILNVIGEPVDNGPPIPASVEPTGSARMTFASEPTLFRKRAMPVMVPPEPMPATKASTS